MKGKTYYLAGPMSGRPNDNIPAFEDAAGYLRHLGYHIFSPVEMEQMTGQSKPSSELSNNELRRIARQDMLMIAEWCDGIILLPGWEVSKGAKAEYALARWLGMECYELRSHSLYEIEPKALVI